MFRVEDEHGTKTHQAIVFFQSKWNLVDICPECQGEGCNECNHSGIINIYPNETHWNENVQRAISRAEAITAEIKAPTLTDEVRNFVQRLPPIANKTSNAQEKSEELIYAIGQNLYDDIEMRFLPTEIRIGIISRILDVVTETLQIKDRMLQDKLLEMIRQAAQTEHDKAIEQETRKNERVKAIRKKAKKKTNKAIENNCIL